MGLPQIYISRVSFEVFQHNTEDQEKIFMGFKQLIPEDHEFFFAHIIRCDRLKGYHKNPILRYYGNFTKKKQANRIGIYILTKFSNHLTSDTLITRLNTNSELFFRINKQILIKSGDFFLDVTSDIYKVTIKFSVHRKTKEKEKLIISFIENSIGN